jgi:hypothetical protein
MWKTQQRDTTIAVRPEHLKKRIERARNAGPEADRPDLAAAILEDVIDDYLRVHVGQLIDPPGVVRFALADGTDSDVVDDVVGRYRSVGWAVERERIEDGESICFRLIKPLD